MSAFCTEYHHSLIEEKKKKKKKKKKKAEPIQKHRAIYQLQDREIIGFTAIQRGRQPPFPSVDLASTSFLSRYLMNLNPTLAEVKKSNTRPSDRGREQGTYHHSLVEEKKKKEKRSEVGCGGEPATHGLTKHGTVDNKCVSCDTIEDINKGRLGSAYVVKQRESDTTMAATTGFLQNDPKMGSFHIPSGSPRQENRHTFAIYTPPVKPDAQHSPLTVKEGSKNKTSKSDGNTYNLEGANSVEKKPITHHISVEAEKKMEECKLNLHDWSAT
ncbi:unnamed protein product [Dovyalis caffra]|uniref:Uncharacterized protein n=1 Tax=Dovyalis caffra TaxID=77055 RepID=A0AAV1RS33_9ROSI|nr:unnamed protein product [Dovyalis caffra]